MIPSTCHTPSAAASGAYAFRYLLLALLWLAAMSARAEILVLDASLAYAPLVGHVQVLEDDTGQLTIDDVNRPEHSDRLKALDTDSPNFGPTRSAFWFRLTISNPSSSPATWYFLMDRPRSTAQFDLYTAAPGQPWLHRQSGLYSPPGTPGDSLNHVFTIDTGPHKTQTLWLRAIATDTALFPLRLYSPTGHAQREKEERAWFGLYYGMMGGLLLFNLLICLSLRDKAYVAYVGFLAGTLLHYSMFNGIFQVWFLQDWPRLSAAVYLASYGVIAVLMLLFVHAFLGFEDRQVRLSGLTTRLIILIVLATLPVMFETPLATISLTSVGMLTDVFCVYSGVVVARTGNPEGRYYLVAWSVFMVGVIIFCAAMVNLLPANNFTIHAMQAGSVGGAILLSLALAARMRHLMTEKDTAQQRMRDNERLATLGFLSAGIAHDINNPNNFARLSVQNANDRIGEFRRFVNELIEDDEEGEVRQHFEQRFSAIEDQLRLAEEGTSRIADIVAGMRSASRNDAAETRSIDAVQGLENTLKLVMTHFKDKVRPVTQLSARPAVEGRLSQLNQVFMNLLINACHAIEEKMVSTADTTPGTLTLVSRQEGQRLVITIQDSGCGMSDTTLKAMFTPFYTTKDASKGTGLGMSICKDIIESHGGSIAIASQLGEGTTITVALPVTPASAA